jgi:hypothetical protein
MVYDAAMIHVTFTTKFNHAPTLHDTSKSSPVHPQRYHMLLLSPFSFLLHKEMFLFKLYDAGNDFLPKTFLLANTSQQHTFSL